MVGVATSSGNAPVKKVTMWESRKCVIICILLATSTFQYGLDTGIINGFQAMQGFLRVFGVESKTKPGFYIIPTDRQQLITSLLQLGLIVASCITGPFSRFWGRRAGVFVASVLSCVGIVIQIVVTDIRPIYVGRLLLGIGNGMYTNLVVLYMSEASPPALRGAIVSTFQPFVSVGGVVGAVINNALKTHLGRESYQIQLGVLFIVPVWLCFYVWSSPRWLATQNRSEDALKALARLRAKPVDDISVAEELATINRAIEAERRLAATSDWREMFRGTDLRRTLLTIACTTFHASSGVNFLVGYATVFFVVRTSNPFVDSIILKCVGTAGALAGIPFAKWFGRKSLLSSGFAICGVSMFVCGILSVYTVAPDSQASGRGMVAFLCLFQFGYSYSSKSRVWVAAGEMSSNRLRSYTFGVGMAIGFFFAWLTVFTTPYFINPQSLNWGAKVTYIWGGSCIISFIFIIFWLPETKNLTLEQLDVLFQERVGARHFQSMCPHISFLSFATMLRTFAQVTSLIRKALTPSIRFNRMIDWKKLQARRLAALVI
ncbi:general substrate transporter [Atractiella rhizophila]|nr:general substrate transporter [Atractiella rhizophila]